MTEPAQKQDTTENEITVQDDFDALRLLEAILFSSPDLLKIDDLLPFFKAGTDIQGLLEQLEEKYDNAGVQLVHRGTAWGFRTAPDLADKLEITQVVNKPLSKAATEMLAIIAYHQPVTKAEIEQIRGVTVSKSTLDILLEENLIQPGRRRETPGRPVTWKTTEHFLDYFSLENIRDLPNLKELKDSGFLTVEPPEFLRNFNKDEDTQAELDLADDADPDQDEA